MKNGAHDPMARPLSPGHLELVIPRTFERASFQRAERRAQEEVGWETSPIVGESATLRRAVERAQRAAACRSTVLLLGETGTGKEVFARAIHAWSPRHPGPFVVVNCAALSEELVASELFGHERGAFTGAHQRRQGKLELADGGTVFLDEIGEMSPALQTKLLRVLQERAFERVGGTGTIRVDIRVMAATNRDLDRAVKEGRFREDLFFRLNVIPITLAPLRARREDVPLLAEFFLKKLGEELERPGVSLSAEAYEALLRYDWPGNVRELHNLLERAVVLSDGNVIGPEDLALATPATATSDYQARLDAAEKDVLLHALRDHGGDKRAAARALGIALSTLYERLKKHQDG